MGLGTRRPATNGIPTDAEAYVESVHDLAAHENEKQQTNAEASKVTPLLPNYYRDRFLPRAKRPIHDTDLRQIDPRLNTFSALSTRVAATLLSSLNWDLDAAAVDVAIVRRRDLRRQLEHELHLNGIQAFVLSRVLGVWYSSQLDRILVIDEVTRTWSPSRLNHALVKALVRYSLSHYAADVLSVTGDTGPIGFADKLTHLYVVPSQHRQSVHARAYFHQAHAEAMAQHIAPENSPLPFRQRLWSYVLRVVLPSYRLIIKNGIAFRDKLQTVLALAPDVITRVYHHGTLAQALFLGRGTVHVDTKQHPEVHQLRRDAEFLRSLNPEGGAVNVQLNLGGILNHSVR